MGVAALVELFVCLDHLFGDPGPVLIGARDRGATTNHLAKVGVEFEPVGRATHGFVEATVDSQLRRLEHEAGIGRVP